MNKGFSLVELIVVIAIMAILVGVAVPTYTAYITKAEKSVELQTVGDMVYAAKLANVEFGTKATLEISADGKSVTLTFSDTDDETTKENSAAAQVKSIVESAGATASGAVVSFPIEHITEEDITDYKNELK